MSIRKTTAVALFALAITAAVVGACATPTTERLGEVQQAICIAAVCENVTPHHTCVDDVCVNLLVDEDNCGTVGTQCTPPETCQGGSCSVVWKTPGQSCLAPEGNGTTSNCGPPSLYTGWCADLDEDGYHFCINIESDPDHCGPSNVQCGEGEVCEHGKCALGEGMECDPDAGPEDYDAMNGRGAVHCYTGRAGLINEQFAAEDRPWAPIMLSSYAMDTETQLECCDDGTGHHTCADILADDNCGECGGMDCSGSELNPSCVVDPSDPARAPFCACMWTDPHASSVQFEECGNEADSCSNGGPSGPPIGCSCNGGPAATEFQSCVWGVPSCTNNDDCPYGQVCDSAGARCYVAGCNTLADCTGTSNSVGVAFSSDTPVSTLPSGVAAGLRCETTDPVATPPAGYSGICVDISSDPAYCGASEGSVVGTTGRAVNAANLWCGVPDPSTNVRSAGDSAIASRPRREVPTTVAHY